MRSSIDSRGRYRRMRRRLGTLVSLRPADWHVLLEACVTLVAVKLGLHTVEFKRLMSWASRVNPGVAGDLSRQQIERTAWLVGVASRVTLMRCLARSLALTRVLARRGVPTTMRIGVRTLNGTLMAHAWVEWRGRALGDDERSLQQFAPFESLEGLSKA